MKPILQIVMGLAGLVPAAVLARPGSESRTTFAEKGGVVAIEAESTKSGLGRWEKKTDVADFTGPCHLEFTGNNPEGGQADSPLKYTFIINKQGVYHLTLRARKRLESKRADISNDCYVSMAGDYEAAGEAPLDVLRADTKMFGGNADDWGWATQLDASHRKFPALYRFKAGETYTLTIHGRSRNFNIDRILLVHEDKGLDRTQRENPPESRPAADRSMAVATPARVKRTLHNTDGRTVEVELLEKRGDSVVVLIRGVRREIPLATVKDEDRKFIEEWSKKP